MFRSHVIGSEPIAINRAQILPSELGTENFIKKIVSNPRPLAVAVVLGFNLSLTEAVSHFLTYSNIMIVSNYYTLARVGLSLMPLVRDLEQEIISLEMSATLLTASAMIAERIGGLNRGQKSLGYLCDQCNSSLRDQYHTVGNFTIVYY